MGLSLEALSQNTSYNANSIPIAGTNNTGIGYQSLFSITTGNYNTCVGTLTLKNTSSGAYNTGTGNYALYSNTTGNNNTATAAEALIFNTSGAANTAIGHQAFLPLLVWPPDYIPTIVSVAEACTGTCGVVNPQLLHA